MKHAIAWMLFINLIIVAGVSRAEPVIGSMFQSEIAGSSCWSMDVVIGQQDIDRNILELITIPYSTCISILTVGYIGDTETASLDAYRVNCKNKTFSVRSKAKVQYEYNAFAVGNGPKFEGDDVQIDRTINDHYIGSDMIETFKKACR